ncbi:hypothetical protein Sru01_24820 [Sphaerisporangium rufum]|uniref:Uncharacterized protein n=1 Tax=Sphaerisporangium rufum TaxID=1381558 RepID=A0A919R348_9ACTN|nr:hypothetical protein [Sphaerisporangium rufum]GII77500.1 hypothetical protein Sru01_24820 [Sphaerisporangium rufum]
MFDTLGRPSTIGAGEPMPASITHLRETYGKHWLVSDAVGGGWYAVRRHGVSRALLQRGLSNVRCAATLDELAGHLAAESLLESRLAVVSPDAEPAAVLDAS